jgi:hypothetical protein
MAIAEELDADASVPSAILFVFETVAPVPNANDPPKSKVTVFPEAANIGVEFAVTKFIAPDTGVAVPVLPFIVNTPPPPPPPLVLSMPA